MRQQLLLLLFLLVCTCCYAQKTGKNRTILFVGAHPDDETAISEVLHKYASMGNKVYVIIATDGKDGTRVTKIPAGDSLGKLRRLESECGCKTLGLEPPIFLGIERLDTKIGTGKYFREHQRFLDSLKMKIPQINPDIIICAGPDGDTHHSEHIVVNGTVTELLLAEGWVDRYPLYFFAWTKQVESVDPGSVMDEQYVNVKVTISKTNKEKAIQALNCYVTQYTPEELKTEAANKLAETSNTFQFRRFVIKKGLQQDF